MIQAQKAIDATKKLIDLNTKELSLATLVQIDKDTADAMTAIKLRYDKLRQDILNSNKSKSDKDAAIAVLGKVEDVEVGGAEQTGNNKKLEAAKVLFEEGLITAAQYEEIYQKAVKGQQQLNNTIEEGKRVITSFKDLIHAGISDLFDFAKGSDKSKVLADTITGAFTLATDAMNTFFDLEKQRIQESLNAQTLRLNKEEEIALAQAQSQAETASIQKQFQIKREAAERAAFEKNKKIQLAQAKINLATQLSNLAVIAFAPNPLNIATLGAAGAIMYAIQAVFELATYALNTSRIKAATYKKGGQVLTKKGGRAKGPSHAQGGIPFTYEAEGDELFIVNKKSAKDNRVRTIKGTNAQIASMINEIGGGVSFAKGATLKKFAYGGSLGAELQAPVFQPSSNISFNMNNDKLNELIELQKEAIETQTKLADEQSKRIDRLEVRQVTKSVTDAQSKEAKQTSIGAFK